MSDVPSEVYREILVRLPAESLFRLRSVCKAWLGIIDDPSFIKAHSNNQHYNHTLFVKHEIGTPLFSFSLDSLHFAQALQKIDATPIKQLIRRGVPRLQQLFHVASCNGLLLLSHEDTKKIWAIWNPLTGDCHELPRPNPPVISTDFEFGFGFGYDCDADDYKVVRVDLLENAGKVVIQTRVYSLKSDSWSMIEDSPDYAPLLNPGVYFDGTLYWLSRNMIIALDVRTESYSQLPLPPVIKTCGVEEDMRCGHRLDALDGCLVFGLNYFDTCLFEGWVMKDNGAEKEKSWVKEFSLQLPDCNFQHPINFKLVAYLKAKQQVVMQFSKGFAWFNTRNESVLSFSVDGFPRVASSKSIASSKICPGSLVRLRTRASTKKRKRSTDSSYSVKICVKDDEDYCCNGGEDMWLEMSEEDA